MAAYTTIDDPSAYFQTILFASKGAQTFDGNSDLQPDMIWNKNRDSAGYSHHIVNSVMGVSKLLRVDTGRTEFTSADSITSFNSDGFTVGNDANGYMQSGSDKIVTWAWKAGTSFSNSAGANGADLASAGSYNRTAGFSIVTFTGNATDDQQIYHGLNSIPKVMILKNRTNGNNESWKVYHQSIGNTHALTLDSTAAASSNTEFWSDETPTSTVFTVGRQDATNGSGNTHVVFCFSEVQGYSKFGSYAGNGNADGTFVYTGFSPAWILVKRTNASGWSWYLNDNVRKTFNTNSTSLFPDSSGAESSDAMYLDMLSNGFKMRGTGNAVNNSSGSHIFMAFAEAPFVTSTGVPATAR